MIASLYQRESAAISRVERVERDVHHRLVRAVRVEDDGDEEVVPRRGLHEEENVLVVRVREADVVLELERAVLAPDAVEPPDVAGEVPRLVPVADLDLVLLVV